MEGPKHCFPGWEVVRSIGIGTFGKVYEIRKTDGFGEVEHSAMKTISVPVSASEVVAYRDDGYDDASLASLFRTQVENIMSEFRLMSKLKGNSNIVSYEDHMVVPHENDPGWDILIRMELLNSLPNYFNQVQKDGAVEDEVVIRLGVDICKALELCAKHQIIHRDIKPQNILINPNGDFKLGDFGIARTSDHTTKATKTGTYSYMAPEVYKSEPYNASADICSLGLVMYWMLNARRGPFQVLPPAVPTATQNVEALTRRMGGETLPRPLHGSDALCEIVLKACAYDPKDRFSSPTEMRGALEALDKSSVLVVDSPVAELVPETLLEESPMEDEATVGPFSEGKKATLGEEDETAVALPGIPEEDEEKTIGLFLGATPERKMADKPVKKKSVGGKLSALIDSVKKDGKKQIVALVAAAGLVVFFLSGYLYTEILENEWLWTLEKTSGNIQNLYFGSEDSVKINVGNNSIWGSWGMTGNVLRISASELWPDNYRWNFLLFPTLDAGIRIIQISGPQNFDLSGKMYS